MDGGPVTSSDDYYLDQGRDLYGPDDGEDDSDELLFPCQVCGAELGFDAPSICPCCGEFA